jgi:hypothetical protein
MPPLVLTNDEAPAGVLVRARAERLDGMAHLLAPLERPFTVHHPDELRQALEDLADRLIAAAEPGPEALPR